MTATLALSTFRPHLISMEPGKATQVVCPECSSWRRVDRRRIVSHGDCPGSRQLLDMDLSYEQWQEQLREGVVSAAGVTAHRVHAEPRIAKGSAASQIGQARQRLAELAAHTSDCPFCQHGWACPTAAQARRRMALAAHTARCGTCQIGRPCVVGRQLGHRVALDQHRAACRHCQYGLPCTTSAMLIRRVDWDEHRADCPRCRAGRPCTAGAVLQVRVDADTHAAHCRSCRSGHECPQGRTVKQRLHRLVYGDVTTRNDRRREAAERAVAPRRYCVPA